MPNQFKINIDFYPDIDTLTYNTGRLVKDDYGFGQLEHWNGYTFDKTLKVNQ
jgi:hypothetical protein